MSTNTDHYTVAWIDAIETEYTVALEMLDEEYPPEKAPRIDQETNPNKYRFGRMGDHAVVIACLPKGNYGTDSTTAVVTRLRMTFHKIRFGLMVGIAGGAPSSKNDIRLGDVVVSSLTAGHGGVIQYDFGKAIQSKGFQLTRYLTPPPEILRSALGELSAEHKRHSHGIQDTIAGLFRKNDRFLETHQRPERDVLCKATYEHVDDETCECRKTIGTGNINNLEIRKERSPDCDDPVIHYGLVASGNMVVKDAIFRDKLAKDHDILCFEMEAAGLMDQLPCVVIRGICDYADTHKNDDWQGYAAATASAYAKKLLSVISGEGMEEMPGVDQHDPLSNDTHRMSDADLRTSIARLRARLPMNNSVHDELKKLRNDQNLLVKASDYWSHMTLHAYDIYEKLYELMTACPGEKNVLWFVKCIGSESPDPSRIIEIWERFKKNPRQPLSKPYSIALLYMLHMEVFCSKFADERPIVDWKRRSFLRRFTTWSKCTSPLGECNVSWNFASQDWGLPRIGQGKVPMNCLIYNRYLERKCTKSASGGEVDSAYSEQENAIMDEAYGELAKAWYGSGSH